MKESQLRKIIREVIKETMSGRKASPKMKRRGASKLGGGKHHRHPSKGPGHNPGGNTAGTCYNLQGLIVDCDDNDCVSGPCAGWYPYIPVCMEPNASNYNPYATFNIAGLCEFDYCWNIGGQYVDCSSSDCIGGPCG